MQVQQFRQNTPKLALEEYFNGHVEAWGVFEDRFGAVRRQFFVDIHGSVDGDMLTLKEDFYYSDGVEETRIWTIQTMNDGSYIGRCDDVVGQANGQAEGNALTWAYDFKLMLGGRKMQVQFRDWFFLQPGGVLMNRATVSKWGVKLGEANITFRRANASVGDALMSEEDAVPLLAAQ